MQISLRSLMACAALVALTVSGVAMNMRYVKQSERIAELQEETALLEQSYGPVDWNYKLYDRFFAAFEKQKAEFEVAEAKYMALAEQLSVLNVDPDTLSVIRLPNTNWGISQLNVYSWRVHVPKQDNGPLYVSVDFRAQREHDTVLSAGSDNKRILTKSDCYLPNKPIRIELPEGESTIRFETYLKEGVCELRILLNDNGVQKFDLTGLSGGNSTSEDAILGAGKQRDVKNGSPLNLIAWTPHITSDHPRETFWLRILPATLAGEVE